MVQWVLIAVGALWPLIAFAGGLGYSSLITLAGLLCVFSAARQMRPQIYMVGIALFLEFVAASVKWSPRQIDLIQFDLDDRKFAMRFEVIRVGLILLWSAILISAARKLSPSQARQVVRVASWAILLQLLIVAALTAFEKQALQLFARFMSDEGEGIQNISRNGIIMALCAPFLIVGFGRTLSFSRALIVEIVVFLIVVAVLLTRGVHGGIVSIGVALGAVAIVRIFPRSGFKILGVLLALIVVGTPWIFGYLSQNAHAEAATTSAEWRLAIWRRVIEVIQNDPIFGNGLGILRTVDERIPSGTFSGMLLVPNHAHNMVLQLWAETGAIGAGLLGATIAAAGFRMPEPRRLSVAGYLAAALAGQFMAIALVSFDLWNDWWWACAGLLAALIVAMGRAEAIEDPGRLLANPADMPPPRPY